MGRPTRVARPVRAARARPGRQCGGRSLRRQRQDLAAGRADRATAAGRCRALADPGDHVHAARGAGNAATVAAGPGDAGERALRHGPGAAGAARFDRRAGGRRAAGRARAVRTGGVHRTKRQHRDVPRLVLAAAAGRAARQRRSAHGQAAGGAAAPAGRGVDRFRRRTDRDRRRGAFRLRGTGEPARGLQHRPHAAQFRPQAGRMVELRRRRCATRDRAGLPAHARGAARGRLFGAAPPGRKAARAALSGRAARPVRLLGRSRAADQDDCRRNRVRRFVPGPCGRSARGPGARLRAAADRPGGPPRSMPFFRRRWPRASAVAGPPTAAGMPRPSKS